MPRFAQYGYTRHTQEISIPFTGFLSVTTQANFLLSKTLGYQAELEKVEIVPSVVGTGAGATRLINVRKGNATGTVIGAVTATLANQGTLGVVTVGTVTSAAAANVLQDSDTFTIEFPTAGSTAFTAGGLILMLTWRVKNQRAI